MRFGDGLLVHMRSLPSGRKIETQWIPGDGRHGALFEGIGVFRMQPLLLPENLLLTLFAAELGELPVVEELLG